MAKESIGTIACECGARMRVVETKKGGKYCATCSECGTQTFTRSEISSARMRARLQPLTTSEAIDDEQETQQRPAAPAAPAGGGEPPAQDRPARRRFGAG